MRETGIWVSRFLWFPCVVLDPDPYIY
jgi:hypothetical protein